MELVLEQLSYNLDLGELLAAYPRLAEEDVKACIDYAQDADRLDHFPSITRRTVRVRR